MTGGPACTQHRLEKPFTCPNSSCARALRRMPCCSSALLMGCSSGSLSRAGQYEPSGPVLAYLMAGADASHPSKAAMHDLQLCYGCRHATFLNTDDAACKPF